MSAATWNVEAQSHGSTTWSPYVDRLSRDAALATADVAARLYPEWTLRLLDTATAEVVPLGRDGKPKPIDVTRLDRRTVEQVEADRLGDRYEASLERER